jgi:Putative auto-transporter adhesin, head GIN domain
MPRAAFALAAILLASPAFAATPVQVGHFDQIELHGGGHVTVKHGAAQSVTLLKGSADITKFEIHDGSKLIIYACKGICTMEHYDLDIEIVTPDLASAAIHGGGDIVAEGAFPARSNFAAAIHGGGDVDMLAISAATVEAAVHGGGDIHVTATKQLTAAVDGGGDISYRGNPQVTEAVHGGGEIEREGK